MSARPSSIVVPDYDGDGAVLVPEQTLSLPETLSQEAAFWLGRLYRRAMEGRQALADGGTVDGNEAERRARTACAAAVRKQFEACQAELLESGCVSVRKDNIEGVDVDIVIPADKRATDSESRIVLHFNDDRSPHGLRLLTTAIGVSRRLGVRVVVPTCPIANGTARHRLLEELLRVHEHFVQTLPPGNVGWMGECKGAELCASLLVLAYQQGMDGPGAAAFFGIAGLDGECSFHNRYLDVTNPDAVTAGVTPAGTQSADPYDPVLYPINANMQIFPPSMLFAGTRDTNFDSTVIFHREMKRAGCRAQLQIFDGLPQSFHLQSDLPESDEAFERLTQFFDSELGGVSAVTAFPGDRRRPGNQAPLSESDDEQVLLPKRRIRWSEHISPDAQAYFHSMFIHYNSQFGADTEVKSGAEIRQHFVSRWKDTSGVKNALAAEQFRLEVEQCHAGTTRVDVIHPPSLPGKTSARALIHFCGGVEFLGNEQLDVALQMARMMNVTVYVPRYRPFPVCKLSDQDEDVLNAYRLVQGAHEGCRIGVFGESSGATVTARLIDQCAEHDLAIPGAIALLGIGGLRGDSELLNQYLDPMAIQYNIVHASMKEKIGRRAQRSQSRERTKRMIERELSALHSYPATMLVTGTRDQLLSPTAHFHRRLLEAGVDAELDVYESMPHSHHTIGHLPEAEETLRELADYFDRKLQ